MNLKPPREITEAEIQTYREDGVVLLKGLFDPEWVDFLRVAAEKDMESPGPLCQELTASGKSGRFYFNTFMWTYSDAFRRFVFGSPAASIAGQVMQSSKVNVFFDQLLIKEPGTEEETPWHHDMPYWPVRGNDICTVWLALDSVTKESGAVEYVKGSHKWGKAFRPPAFAGDDKYKIDLPAVPDIANNRSDFDFIQFELEPGDCTVHHGLLVHGAPGNSVSERRRRAVVSRWAGDDAVYYPLPNIQKMMWDPDIPKAGPLDSDLWPVVWQRDGGLTHPEGPYFQHGRDVAKSAA